MVVIAIVDDDESILDAMTLLVEGQGWDAAAYVSGEAFLDDYRRNGKIDCLILDPHLGGISGEDIAQALSGSSIPIIGLTARPESPVTQSIIELGVETMLTKPVQPKHLVEIIKQLLSDHS